MNSPGLFWPTSYLSRVGSAAGAQHLIPNDYVNRVGEAGANKSPVGSGPYKFKNLIAGSSIEFEAVDKYWYYGVPRVKSLTFSHIPEEGTRIALLKTNGADLAPISKSQAAAMKKEPNLKTFLRAALMHSKHGTATIVLQTRPRVISKPTSACMGHAVARQQVRHASKRGQGAMMRLSGATSHA